MSRGRQPKDQTIVAVEPGVQLQPALTRLLDHVAEQLACEYVELMEVAARNEGRGQQEDR